MLSKWVFLLCAALMAVGGRGVSTDDSKTRGGRVLITKSDVLYLTDPSGVERRKIAENVGAAALSKDGNFVAYEKDAGGRAVFVLSLGDGETAKLVDISEGRIGHMMWSPDGKSIAYDVEVPMKNWDLFVVAYPANGEPPRNLGHWYESLDFSPNGKFVVHPSRDPVDHNILETVNVETGKHETIYKAATTVWEAKYAPDGRSIAFTMTKFEPPSRNQAADDDEPECGGPQTDLWILPLDSKNPVKIMERVFDFDWSPDGSWLAMDAGTEDCGYPPGDAAVFISSRDGKEQFQLSKNAPSINARFSPDSKRVMFVEYDAAQFVVGDLKTRDLTTLAGEDSRSGVFQLGVLDWK